MGLCLEIDASNMSLTTFVAIPTKFETRIIVTQDTYYGDPMGVALHYARVARQVADRNGAGKMLAMNIDDAEGGLVVLCYVYEGFVN